MKKIIFMTLLLSPMLGYSDNGLGFNKLKHKTFSLNKEVSVLSFANLKRSNLPRQMNSNIFNAPKEYGAGKSATLKSIAIPGWGLYAASGQKYWFAAAPIVWGLIGFGVYSKIKSKNSYELYLNSLDQTEMDEYYDKANSTSGLFVWTIAAGVGLYAAQIAATFFYGYLNDYYRNRNTNWTSQSNWTVFPAYDFRSKNVNLTLNLKF
jgi:hypothetical protein